MCKHLIIAAAPIEWPIKAMRQPALTHFFAENKRISAFRIPPKVTRGSVLIFCHKDVAVDGLKILVSGKLKVTRMLCSLYFSVSGANPFSYSCPLDKIPCDVMTARRVSFPVGSPLIIGS